MGDMEGSYLKAVQTDREKDLLEWADKQDQTSWDTPAQKAQMNPEKPKTTTWKQRAFKTGQETLNDPNSTWIERFLGGVTVGTQEAARETGKQTDIIAAASSWMFARYTVPWEALKRGFREMGASKNAVDALDQLALASVVSAGMSPGGFHNLNFDRWPRRTAREVTPETPPVKPNPELDASIGRMKKKFQAKMADQMTADEPTAVGQEGKPARRVLDSTTEDPVSEFANEPRWMGQMRSDYQEPARSHHMFGDLINLIRDGREKEISRREGADRVAKIINENPEATDADLVRMSLGGITEEAAGVKPPGAPTTPSEPSPATPQPPTAETATPAPAESQDESVPASGETAEAQKLTPWQQSMLDESNTVTAAKPSTPGEPAAPAAAEKPFSITEPGSTPTADRKVGSDYPAGFKHVPEGEQELYSRIATVLGEEQKRGVMSHDVQEAAADTILRDKKLTAQMLLDWERGKPANVETARAARKLVRVAHQQAEALWDLADKGEFPREAAIKAKITALALTENAAAMYSEMGRGLESARHMDEPASPMKLIDVMPSVPLVGGAGEPLTGSALVDALTKKVIQDAGGSDLAMREVNALQTAAQRRQLGSLWFRAKQAAIEYFMTTIFSPLTSLKILSSGEMMAAGQIALKGAGEFPKRLINTVMPNLFDTTKGVMAGDTWHELQGMIQANAFAWRSIRKFNEARIAIAKKEGGMASVLKLQGTLREALPEYGEGTRNWNYQPKVSSANAPEIQEHLGELVARGVDVIGAGARAMTTDLLGISHGFTFEVNWYQGAYAKAAKMATAEGLRGDAWDARVHTLIENHEPSVHAAGMERARDNTFLKKIEGDLGRISGANQNAAIKLFLAPVMKFPLNSFMKGMELVPVLQHFSRSFNLDLMGKNGPERQSLARTKMAVGWATAVPLMQATWNGNITGARPNGVLGQVWDAQGKKEYSWGTGDHMISYHWMHPLSDWIGTMANFAQYWRQYEGANIFARGALIFAAAGEDFMDMGLLQGMSRVVEGLAALKSDPNKAAELLRQDVITPLRTPLEATMAIASKYMDDKRRQARTLSEYWLRDLPGWSDSLPPTRNILTNEPLLHEGLFGPGSESLFATSSPGNHPVLNELIRLKGAGLQEVPDHIEGPNPAPYLQGQDVKPSGVHLTPWQRDRWKVIMKEELRPGGKTLEQSMTDLVMSDAYQNRMGDLQRVSEIQSLWHKYRAAAQETLINEDPELKAAWQGVIGEKAVRHLAEEAQPAARSRLLSTVR